MEILKNLPEGFAYLKDIDPSIIINLRYTKSSNFVGEPIKGYNSSTAGIITLEAGKALKNIQEKLKNDGFSLVLYDSYRPQQAVDRFVEWSEDLIDQNDKEWFYPRIEKKNLFELGYIAKESGHSRGSTVDVSIIELESLSKK